MHGPSLQCHNSQVPWYKSPINRELVQAHEDLLGGGCRECCQMPERLRALMSSENRLSMAIYRVGQSLHCLSRRVREVWHTPITNIHTQKQGTVRIWHAETLADMNMCWRAEIVCWVTENLHLFQIIEDQGFQCLMKTGRPVYYLPSARTVAWDVQEVFIRTQQQLAKMLSISIVARSNTMWLI